MATNVSYPGVYIKEVPSGVRTIAGVATSVAAFVGYTARGPVDQPVQIFSFADFERRFGGLDLDSDLSYAVSHFFLNGGGTAWIVRVAAGAKAAAIGLKNDVGGSADLVLTASAVAEGAWGNGLQITVDYDTSNPASLFNLTVEEVQDKNGARQVVRSEVHRNLSMNSSAANYAVNVVNAASQLIRLDRPTGLSSADKGTSISGAISDTIAASLTDGARRLAISVDGSPVYEFELFEAGKPPQDLTELAAMIEAAVTKLEPAKDAFKDFECKVGTDSVVATSGSPGEQSSVVFSNAGQSDAATILKLGLVNGGRETTGAASLRPAQSGTVWKRHPDVELADVEVPAKMKVKFTDSSGSSTTESEIELWSATKPTSPEELRATVEAGLRSVLGPEFSNARVLLVDGQLVAIPGGADRAGRFDFTESPADVSDPLFSSDEPNVAAYQLGIGPAAQAQQDAVPGSDGTSALTPNDIKGSRLAKSGMYALEEVDLFNLLVLSNQSDPSLLAEAIAYAEERRAFALIDLPAAVDTLAEATAWLSANGGLRHKNAAAYFPRAKFADPLQDNRLRSFANSGAVAGLYARTDGERGVWKAPAGTDAVLRGVRELDYVLTDPENGVLNPLGLNAVRLSPAFGPIAWGARTLVGSDSLASEWKYIPIRRLALFIEESLYRGTQWVVFEPNDEPLWSQIRLNVGAFMHTLFRQGAFQGSTPKDAYLVQCDSTTTTQDDINLGIVNIVVGFAPLKPAEFVIIKLQQLAGQAGAGA